MATLIFDFDGTIADTLASIVLITNRLAPEYGFSPTTAERLAYYRSLTPQQLIEESEIPLFRIPFLVRRVRRELKQEVAQLRPIEGLPTALQQLSHRHRLMIMSSNATGNIRQFLSQHGLANLFDPIYANVSLLGKARRLRRILQHHELPLNTHRVFYVGDETRDVEAANQAGIPIVAVSWGFSDRTALQSQNPAFLVDTPEQLLALGNSLPASDLLNPNSAPKRPRLDGQTETLAFEPP